MNLSEIAGAFIQGMKQTTALEYIAVFSGIVSVWFSKRENILVYPIGLINTMLYVYLSLRAELPGEASVNLYYSIMSIYGWAVWSRRDRASKPVLKITYSRRREWVTHLLFFIITYAIIFFALEQMKKSFTPGAIPYADALASATAFTGMWLMTRKKVESWYWWIATNIASIPLYFVKGYVFTSVYYLVLLGLAVSGLVSWKRKYQNRQHPNTPVE